MVTIEITIDEPLLKEVDDVSRRLHTTRSELIQAAVTESLKRLKQQALERRDAEGYARQPLEADEVEVWQAEQVWEDV